MADDIARWLEGLGLGQYAQAFAENDIDLRALPHLSDDDLKELGLSLGHRRILQGVLPPQAALRFQAMESFGGILLLGLFVSGGLRYLITPVSSCYRFLLSTAGLTIG